MANILLDPSYVVDGFGNSPPSQWNTATGRYEFLDTWNGSHIILHAAPANEGDIVAGTFTVVVPNTDGAAWYLRVNDDVTQTIDLTVAGETEFSTAPLRTGDLVDMSGDTSGNMVYGGEFTITPTPDPAPPAPTYNCDCDGHNTNRTLAELRTSLARRLGFSAQATNLPPGMKELLDSFLQDAQRALYRRYDVLDTERFFTWNMSAGVRFYDVDGNDDECTKRVDIRKLTWAGVSRDGEAWTELRCGINPVRYSSPSLTGRPDSYEVRQCIEVWPAPDDDAYKLRIKGHFGLQPFAADTDQTTIDDALVFLLALSNAKAHYGQPDAGNYIAEMETMMQNLVAGAHETRRYIPGRDGRYDGVYVEPKPTEPF